VLEKPLCSTCAPLSTANDADVMKEFSSATGDPTYIFGRSLLADCDDEAPIPHILHRSPLFSWYTVDVVLIQFHSLSCPSSTLHPFVDPAPQACGLGPCPLGLTEYGFSASPFLSPLL
jgi:hypothetical protein